MSMCNNREMLQNIFFGKHLHLYIEKKIFHVPDDYKMEELLPIKARTLLTHMHLLCMIEFDKLR